MDHLNYASKHGDIPEEQWGTIEEIWEEESQNWEPTDDEIMGAFGTPWHDGI